MGRLLPQTQVVRRHSRILPTRPDVAFHPSCRQSEAAIAEQVDCSRIGDPGSASPTRRYSAACQVDIVQSPRDCGVKTFLISLHAESATRLPDSLSGREEQGKRVCDSVVKLLQINARQVCRSELQETPRGGSGLDSRESLPRLAIRGSPPRPKAAIT
jgi:hypothetical protein